MVAQTERSFGELATSVNINMAGFSGSSTLETTFAAITTYRDKKDTFIEWYDTPICPLTQTYKNI